MGLLARIAAAQPADIMTSSSIARNDACIATLARQCSGNPVGTFTLTLEAGKTRRAPLCGACLAVAHHYGCEPVRVARWIELNGAKDMTGGVLA